MSDKVNLMCVRRPNQRMYYVWERQFSACEGGRALCVDYGGRASLASRITARCLMLLMDIIKIANLD